METVTKIALIGYCGVDSGQIMFSDPSYVHMFSDSDEFNPESEGRDYSYSYNGACGATLTDKRAGQLRFPLGHAGAGVVVSSGYGDGFYPVYAEYNEEGRIMSASIVFIPDEDDE